MKSFNVDSLVVDKINGIAVFHDCTPKNSDSSEKYAYSINFVDGQLELRFAELKENLNNVEKILYWLTDIFFPKFYNWAMNDKGSKSTISSLSQIYIKKYCHLYNELKEKYAKPLMDVSLYLSTYN